MGLLPGQRMPDTFIVTRGVAPVQYWTSNVLWSVSRNEAAQFDALAALEVAASNLADLDELSVALVVSSEETADPS